MKITHIDIQRYFALRGVRFSPSAFTVVYGENDSGKTMLLDAIVDTLFGIRGRRERRFFLGFNRYDLKEPQKTEVTVQWAHGTVQLDGSNPLDGFLGLGPIESFLTLRNLLVVRESDIRFGPEKEEQRWWSFVRRRLSGLDGGVERVIAEVARASGVSAKGRWLSPEKKGKFEETQRRLLAVSAAAEEVATLEAISRELARLAEERQKIEQEMAKVEALKKKEMFNKLKLEIEAYRKVREELATLAGVEESLLLQWQEVEATIARHQESLKALRERIEETLAEVRAKEEEAAELMRKTAEWEKKEVSLLPGVERLLGEIRRLHRSRRRHEWVRGAGKVVIAGGVGIIAVGGVLVGTGASPLGGIGMMGLGGAAVALGVVVGLARARMGKRMVRKKEELLSLVASVGVGLQDTEEVERWVESGRREAVESKARAELLLVEARGGRAKLEGLNAKAGQLEEELKRAAERASEISREAGVATLGDLRARLERKRALETELAARKKAIAEMVGSENEEDWFKKMAELEAYTQQEGDYDPEEEETLRKRLEAMDEVERELLAKKEAAEKQLASVGVKTPAEMLVEVQRLRARIEEMESERQNALLAMELLQRLRRAQSAALGFVLRHATDAATTFRSLTGDHYNRLVYRDGLLFAETRNGSAFPLDHLSSGARALAFFAIRLALLKKLIPSPAFLLLDDPFIFCDKARLERALNVLLQLVNEGWQVLYLTHDERVLEWTKKQKTADISLFNLSPPPEEV